MFKQNFSYRWLEALHDIINNGVSVAPRGQPTREILQRTMAVNMRYPVLTVPARKLSYQFMAAEAIWILSGDNRVDTIAPWNKRIAQFSDNGETFFGAYGPKILDQLNYVVHKLRQDPDTRQAGLTIWRENPPETKDVPCTIAIFFNIRHGKLNCHVFMRSSDIWLGVPYDVFNFSMLGHAICAALNDGGRADTETLPGTLYLTAASSHLYLRNMEAARACLDVDVLMQNPTPPVLFTKMDMLSSYLRQLRDSKPGHPLRWWEMKDE
jgi:thymidylate synthase